MRLPKLSALFLTTAIAMVISAQALALDVGQKGSFAEIEKKLLQEKLIEVANAEYTLNHDDPKRVKFLRLKFTINAKGDAYILLYNRTDDEKTRVEVVYGKMKNAYVYDPKNIGVLPQNVPEQSNLAKMIKLGAKASDGVLIHGESVKKSADGSDAVVGLTTVMANTIRDSDPYSLKRGRVVILVSSSADLVSVDEVVGSYFNYGDSWSGKEIRRAEK